MSVHQRLEAVTDLSKLSPISDNIIVACLHERFMTDTIYTNIGALGLVALNPHKYISSNTDSILQKYAAEYRDSSEIFHHIYFRSLITLTITCEGQRRISPLYLRQYLLTHSNLTLDSPSSLLEAKQAVENQKIVGWQSSRSQNLASATRGKKAQNQLLNSLPQSSSWRHSETLAHSLILTPLVLEIIPNFSSQIGAN